MDEEDFLTKGMRSTLSDGIRIVPEGMRGKLTAEKRNIDEGD